MIPVRSVDGVSHNPEAVQLGSPNTLGSGMTLFYDNPALLIIDVQEGSFSISGSEIDQPETFLSRVSKLASSARGSGVPIVYTQFYGPPDTSMALGSPGSEVHSAVPPREGDLVVPKNDSDAFLRSNLKSELDRLDIKSLIVCGMQTEFCVDATCRTGYALGYRVALVEDAHATSHSEALRAPQIIAHHNLCLSRAYVSLVQASEVFG